jgi:cytochrome bd-type quinol oxidase subunit 2
MTSVTNQWFNVLFALLVFAVLFALYEYFRDYYDKDTKGGRTRDYVDAALASAIITGVIFAVSIIILIMAYIRRASGYNPKVAMMTEAWSVMIWATLLFTVTYSIYRYFVNYDRVANNGTTSNFTSWSLVGVFIAGAVLVISVITFIYAVFFKRSSVWEMRTLN